MLVLEPAPASILLIIINLRPCQLTECSHCWLQCAFFSRHMISANTSVLISDQRIVTRTLCAHEASVSMFICEGSSQTNQPTHSSLLTLCRLRIQLTPYLQVGSTQEPGGLFASRALLELQHQHIQVILEQEHPQT